MAIRSPKHNSQGFTLIEMLVAIMVAGIIMGFGTHSFLSLNKPLRYGSSQFKSHLSLIRSKAISSNKAYRLKPKYSTAAEYAGQTPHNFIVEYAANCQVTTSGYGFAKDAASATTERPYNAAFPLGRPDGWMVASQLDLDLPEEIGVATTVPSTIPNIVTVSANGVTTIPSTPLDWKVCYDNRGVAAEAVSVVLADFQGNNKAKYVLVEVIGVGNIDVTPKNSEGTNTSSDPNYPEF